MFVQHQHQSSSLYRAPASGRPVVDTQRTPAPATWHHLATTISLSRPQDPSEREADRVADAVMGSEPAGAQQQRGAGLRRMCAVCGEEPRQQDSCGWLQAKADAWGLKQLRNAPQ